MKPSWHLTRSVAAPAAASATTSATASTATSATTPKTASVASTIITAVRETAWGAIVKATSKFVGTKQKDDSRDYQGDHYPHKSYVN